MKILIVDDNSNNLYMLKSLLEGNSYQAEIAENGKIALELLQADSFNLIISDILMPVMDGFQLCREVKTNPQLKHIYFLFYTATYTGPQDEALAMDLGGDAFIVKPCDPETIITIVKGFLDTEQSPKTVVPYGEHSEAEILKLYNERLVRKLEQKMMQNEEEIKAKEQALTALHRSEALLNATQSISKIGGWEWDAETNQTYWTEETYRIHELEPIPGTSIAEDIPAMSLNCYEELCREKLTEAFLKCAFEGIAYQFECPLTTHKGNKIFVQTAGKAVYKDDKIVKVIGYIQDITDRKRAEDTQNELKEQLRQAQKLDSIGQLAGGVAHDFNNILTVILGYAQEIIKALRQDDPLYSDITEIEKAGHRALSLTRKLLTFSRKQVIQPQVLNLNSIILEMKKMMERLIGEDIKISIKLCEDVFLVKADEGQVEQIIMNLVINARDAMSKGGELKIETANIITENTISPLRIDIPAGEYVLLTIADNGCGMTKETMERIFEPFFTTKEQFKGTGLGLSTVYGIVKQSHGYIWVGSTPGKGSVFHVLLPRTNEIAEKNVVASALSDYSGKGELVLMVDDDVNIRRLAKNMLQNAGFKVTVAVSGEEALMFVGQGKLKPDYMVTDLIMPGISGLELAQKMRSYLPELKTLFMSGYVDSDIIQSQIIDQKLPFMQKPFSAKDLAMQIRQLQNNTLPSDMKTCNVLMLDDEEDIIRLYRRFFKKHGLGFIGVNNASEVPDILVQNEIDVLLIDMNLGITDGVSVLKEIRAAGFQMPVIILSGIVDTIDTDNLDTMGKVFTMEKSFDNEKLFQLIKELCHN